MKHAYGREVFGNEMPVKGQVIVWNFHHDDWQAVRILSDKGYPFLSGDYEVIKTIYR